MDKLEEKFNQNTIVTTIIVGALIIASIIYFSSVPNTHKQSEVSVPTSETSTQQPIDQTADIHNVIDNSEPSNLEPKEQEGASVHAPKYIYVKYRNDPIDISHPRFEHLDTSKSSLVKGAWYDEENRYMIINLSGTYYHYCSLPITTWSLFKSAGSFGIFYNNFIKSRYDCRTYPVPEYKDSAEEKDSKASEYPAHNPLPYNDSRTISDVYVYGDCYKNSYCYGEDQYGNEIELYAYEIYCSYGYGEDDRGNEIEFYFGGSRTISDVYVYSSCEEGSYCYGEDIHGNEIEFYAYQLYDNYGYGEDDCGNEIEFYFY